MRVWGCDIDIRDNEGGSWLFLLHTDHYSQVFFTEMCSGSEAGSYLRLIDFEPLLPGLRFGVSGFLFLGVGCRVSGVG